MRVSRLAVLVGLVLAAVLTGVLTGVSPASATPGHRTPQPVLAGDFPDPTVALWHGRYVGVATGSLAPRAVARRPAGPWTRIDPALAHLPGWARDDAIWATDLVRGKRDWLLYFSAPVRGLGPSGRCIGVATAPTPLSRFTPSETPLVCPTPIDALPSGVIDPDLHQSAAGTFLTYRTQGVPASIRMVRLDDRGTTAIGPGVTLLTSTGVVENPLLVLHQATWVLITSEGYFGSCSYRTTFRRSTTLAGLATAPREDLVRRRGTHLCGPGGADLVDGRLFFHAWTCPTSRPGCRVHRERPGPEPTGQAKRSLYVAPLRWGPGAEPRLTSYVAPAHRAAVTPTRPDPITQHGPGAVLDGPGASVPPPVGSASPDTVLDPVP